MEIRIPQRRTMIFDHSAIIKKQKLTHESSNLSEKSFKFIEDLPNEIFYEIFDYLDFYDIYQTFSNLNTRFENLIHNSNLPVSINVSSMSKSNLKHYQNDVIMPYKHRITSLHLSNPFSVDMIFSPVQIVYRFERLRTLIFDNIKSKYLPNILKYLVKLPNLTSLTLIPIDRDHSLQNLYQCIVRLPVLKYCKISLPSPNYSVLSLPIATDKTSPVEHLVLNCNLFLSDLNILLSYVPYLRRLKLSLLNGNRLDPSETFSCSCSNLTNLSVRMETVPFDKFETMAKKLFNRLEILHLSVSTNDDYLNGRRWEKLILSAMPRLDIFDLEYKNVIQNIDDNTRLIYNSHFGEFSTSFWFQRKWLFDYKFYSEDYRNRVIFYSIHPYRRKQYKIHKQLIEHIPPHYRKTNMNAVDHLEIQGEKSIMKCVNCFRHATKLTLLQNYGECKYWLNINLKPIISLKHLTTLIIDCDKLRFNEFIDLLYQTKNVHTLSVNTKLLNQSSSEWIQNSEKFRYIANRGSIKNVEIKNFCELKHVAVIAQLCPQMHKLSIDDPLYNYGSIVEDVLLKTKTQLPRLCSIHLSSVNRSTKRKLRLLIKSKALLEEFSMQSIDFECYLWW